MRLEDITLMTNKINYVIIEDFCKIKEITYKFTKTNFEDWVKGKIKHKLLSDFNTNTEIMQIIISDDKLYCEIQEIENEH